MKKIKYIKSKITKNGENIQIDADIISNKILVDELKKSNESLTIYSEEFKAPVKFGKSNINIFLDPLDGSFMFYKGNIRFTSISILITKNDYPIASFVGDILTGDIYHADEKNAYLNNKKIQIKKSNKYLIAGWATGGDRFTKYIPKLRRIVNSNIHYLNYGGPLLSAQVATNNVDTAIEFEPVPLYEFSGALIAMRSGAKLTTLKGDEVIFESNIKQTYIVSSSKKLHERILKIFK